MGINAGKVLGTGIGACGIFSLLGLILGAGIFNTYIFGKYAFNNPDLADGKPHCYAAMGNMTPLTEDDFNKNPNSVWQVSKHWIVYFKLCFAFWLVALIGVLCAICNAICIVVMASQKKEPSAI